MQQDSSKEQNQKNNLAIRFGLGAIKAVGIGMMEDAVKERKANGNFKDLYDFAERLNPRNINKKSIEALAKAGAFDSLNKNRRQIFESFDILSSYSTQQREAASSNQMSLFGGLAEANKKPELKKVEPWSKPERLQKEFEAFSFFLNEHPLDDYLSDLKKRGIIFSDKIERDELEDNNLVKMAGVVAASKHRSGPRGRFAYMTISDPMGIFEAMIFDEALITNARDILTDGSAIVLECLIRKDEGGVRILVREVTRLEEFIRNTKAKSEDFEDIKKQPARRNYNNSDSSNSGQKSFGDRSSQVNSNFSNQGKTKPSEEKTYQEKIENLKTKKIASSVQIVIKERTPITDIKAFLSQRTAPKNFEKFTKVFFTVMNSSKVFKIELNEKYLLDDLDISRLRKIDKVIDVEMV